jgi:hypothetical protein
LAHSELASFLISISSSSKFPESIDTLALPNVGEALNRRHPPFTRGSILSELHQLIHSHVLRAYHRGRPFLPTPPELEMAFTRAIAIQFGHPGGQLKPVRDYSPRWRRPIQQALETPSVAWLQDPNPAVQYAAASQLIQSPSRATLTHLITWFLATRCHSSLDILTRHHSPRILAALLRAFRAERWSKYHLNRAFRHDLEQAIAAYGEFAVPHLTPLLRSHSVPRVLAVLRILGQTGTPHAATAILNWLPTLSPSRCAKHFPLLVAPLSALANLGDPAGLPILAILLTATPGLAIEPLAHYATPPALALLKDFLQSNYRCHQFFHSRAAQALARAEKKLLTASLHHATSS